MDYVEKPGWLSTIRISSAFGRRHASVSAEVARLISRIGWSRAKNMFEPTGDTLDGSPVYTMNLDGLLLVSGGWGSTKALRAKLAFLDEMRRQDHYEINKQSNVRVDAQYNGQPININVTVNLGQGRNSMLRFSL